MSKDMPEKSCGNCGGSAFPCPHDDQGGFTCWQPKAAEPQERCGDCKFKNNLAWKSAGHGICSECQDYDCYQTQNAEPQSWEQRFDAIINLPKDCKNCKWDRESDSGHCTAEPTCDFSPEIDLKKIKSFIRAEIERAREDARNLPPNERAKARSKTFPGIAKSNG